MEKSHTNIKFMLLTNTDIVPFRRETYSDYFQEKAEYIISTIKRFLAATFRKKFNS